MNTQFLERLRATVRVRSIRLSSHIRDCINAASHRSGGAHDDSASIPKRLETEVYNIEQRAVNLDQTQLILHLEQLQLIHESWLPTVPGIEAPIELNSFLRQHDPGNFHDFQVHGSEQLGDSVAPYNGESTAELDDLRRDINKAPPVSATNPVSDLRLPRMDMGAPVRWPTLIHEKQHVTVREHLSHFEEFLGDAAREELLLEFKTFFLPDELAPEVQSAVFSSWCAEIICDLRAFDSIGPALFFSQVYAIEGDAGYFGAAESKLKTHPPPTLRLQLLRQRTAHQLEMIDKSLKERLLGEMDSSIKYLEWLILNIRGSSFRKFPRLRKAIEAWMPIDHSGTSERATIRMSDVEYVIERLEAGEPAPSLSDGTPAPIESILLAGALIKAGPDRAATLRTDEAIRRSIQLREWVCIFQNSISDDTSVHEPANPHQSQKLDALVESPGRENNLPPQEPQIALRPQEPTNLAGLMTGVLVDSEILQLMVDADDPLRIVPLCAPVKQIGSASIDLRLGQYFELFEEGAMRLVDFLDKSSAGPRSREISVDSGKGVIISPGRFILGHTLEYVRLPKNVCGQIEGRSSFGRLGIQVHMTANLIDCGFFGVITLEILNMGPDPVKLYPGMRIAQLRLFRTKAPNRPYTVKDKYSGALRHSVSRQKTDPEIELIRRFNEGKK